MLKIVYPICCGMDVHKSFVYACIASTNEQGVPPTKANAFLHSQKICVSVLSGLPQTIVKTFVWNQRVNIGFPFTTS